MERAYTVTEIDDLRRLCRNKWLFGSFTTVPTGWSRSYKESDMDKGVEELVRTYMLAGLTADAIRAQVAEQNKPETPDGEGQVKREVG